MNEPTQITAELLNVSFKNELKPSIKYAKNVAVNQSKKSLTSNHLTIDINNKLYIAQDNVVLKFKNLKWAIEPNKKINGKKLNSIINSTG